MCSKVKTLIPNQGRLYTALVMAFSDPCSDPRPRRIIQLLISMGYTVDVLSYPPSCWLDINRAFHLVRTPKNFVGKIVSRIRLHATQVCQSVLRFKTINDYLNDFAQGIDSNRRDILESPYGLIIVESLQLLPFAFRIKGKAKVIFDAREYYPKQNEESIYFRLFEKFERTRLCREYLPQCEHVITVSPGLAAEYQQEFGIIPTVVMSVPKYHETAPVKTDTHQIKIVHHGKAKPNRGLENMIEIVKLLDDRYTLDFYLTGSSRHVAELKAYAAMNPRIRFREPVPFEQIIPMLTKYDIGLYFLIPTGFNVTYNLPNKFFEFIQARLMVAIGPSPDMADIVRCHDCGIIADSFSIQAMASVLSRLTVNEIDGAKEKSHQAAKELCFEMEQLKLKEIITNVIS